MLIGHDKSYGSYGHMVCREPKHESSDGNYHRALRHGALLHRLKSSVESTRYTHNLHKVICTINDNE